MPRRRSDSGYLLVFVAVILLTATLFGLVIVADFLSKDMPRAKDSRQLVDGVYRAVVGQQDQEIYGYIGDVGDYPANLQLLVKGTATGWNGPYLRDVPITPPSLLDYYSSPLEFFLVSTSGVSQQLAVISRGPNLGSTNTSGSPNDSTTFTGVLPTSGSYAAGTDNSDNVFVPDFVTDTGSLNYKYVGSLNFNLKNVDTAQSSNVVDACPNLYFLEPSSVKRGTTDSFRISFDSSLILDVVQGFWNVRVTSTTPSGAYTAYTENAATPPNGTIARTVRLFPIDSSVMPSNTLTINNYTGSALTMALNGAAFSPAFTVASGAPGTGNRSVPTCSSIQAWIGAIGSGTLVSSWTMPYNAAQTKVVNLAANTVNVTITNNSGGNRSIGVLAGASIAGSNVLGNVFDRETRVFTVPTNTQILVVDSTNTSILSGGSFVASSSTSAAFQ